MWTDSRRPRSSTQAADQPAERHHVIHVPREGSRSHRHEAPLHREPGEPVEPPSLANAGNLGRSPTALIGKRSLVGLHEGENTILLVAVEETGSASWQTISVTIGGPVCDTIDFNGDGLFPDTADIDDFLSVFSGGPCSTGTCGDTDFNNDGLFPDTADIDSLLSVFSGGPCL